MHGPWAPEQGQWCNPAKLLLDPYTKAVDGMWSWNEALFPYHFDAPEDSRNDLDSAALVPKSVVINPFFDWGLDRRPDRDRRRDRRQETEDRPEPRAPNAEPPPSRCALRRGRPRLRAALRRGRP